MENRQQNYLNEIPEMDWLQEILTEKFDNALVLMPENTIIYGGAIRDALANKKLEGDLDFAIPSSGSREIIENFRLDSRWKIDEIENKKMDIGEGYGGSKLNLSTISEVKCFRNLNGEKIQLVQSSLKSKSWFNSATYVARTVDIICCGVIMTYDGRVFEVLPEAYEHCKAGILVENKFANLALSNKLQSRVEKLSARGWINQIDVPKVMSLNAKKRKKLEKIKQKTDKERGKTLYNVKYKPYEKATAPIMEKIPVIFLEARGGEDLRTASDVIDATMKKIQERMHTRRFLEPPLQKIRVSGGMALKFGSAEQHQMARRIFLEKRIFFKEVLTEGINVKVSPKAGTTGIEVRANNHEISEMKMAPKALFSSPKTSTKAFDTSTGYQAMGSYTTGHTERLLSDDETITDWRISPPVAYERTEIENVKQKSKLESDRAHWLDLGKQVDEMKQREYQMEKRERLISAYSGKVHVKNPKFLTQPIRPEREFKDNIERRVHLALDPDPPTHVDDNVNIYTKGMETNEHKGSTYQFQEQTYYTYKKAGKKYT